MTVRDEVDELEGRLARLQAETPRLAAELEKISLRPRTSILVVCGVGFATLIAGIFAFHAGRPSVPGPVFIQTAEVPEDKRLRASCALGSADDCFHLVGYLHGENSHAMAVRACLLGHEKSCRMISDAGGRLGMPISRLIGQMLEDEAKHDVP